MNGRILVLNYAKKTLKRDISRELVMKEYGIFIITLKISLNKINANKSN